MNQKEQIVRLVETVENIVGLRRDGIMHVYYKDGCEINIELQEKLLEIYREIGGENKRPFIYEAGENVTVTKEARENAIKLEARAPQCCSVVYVNNLAYKLIADFYYKFNKPKKPYKVVTEFQHGIDWLLEVEKKIGASIKS